MYVSALHFLPNFPFPNNLYYVRNGIQPISINSVYSHLQLKSMRHIFIISIVLAATHIHAQSSGGTDILAGNYTANFNNDNIYLSLERNSGTKYSGNMEDSYQTYTLNLSLAGTTVKGTAVESSMNLQFDVVGRVQGEQLSLSFTFEIAGEKKTMDVVFLRQGADAPSSLNLEDEAKSNLSFPSGALHPQEVCGAWTKEELYNSGSGSSYMGAGFSQTLTLLPDGQVTEGASSAYMSGSYYSGQSTGQGSDIIPGLTWYTISNKLFLQVTEHGQLQTVPLGTYYVEGSNMLITGTNGEKLLLSKKN